MNHHYLATCCVLCVASGCTSVPLRHNSVYEAEAVGEVQTQQVLDNLAMFACNPNAMPYFSFPNQSSANVTDTGNAGLTSGWSRFASGSFPFLFSSLGLSVNGSRQAVEGFVVTPINDPRKLELMRCAYQQAVRSCYGREVSTTCPDCQTRFRVFYTGDPNGDIRANAKGTVTSECLNTDGCWFHVGCRKCMAKRCRSKLIGHYHGSCVWVDPAGRNELTKLTLAILDYATHDPPVKLTKSVVYYVDAYGLPTTQSHSVGTVTATVGIDEANVSLLNTPRADEVRLEQFLDNQLRGVRGMLQASQDPDQRKALLEEQQDLQNKLEFLHEQLRAGGLKEQYYLRGTAPAGGILQLQQQLNTLTPPQALPPVTP